MADTEVGTGAEAGRRISVLLVEDHALVREGVREILSLERDIAVIGEAADSEHAISSVADQHPDLVLLDLEIPGRPPAETVAQIRILSPCTRVIMLSIYDSPQLLRRLVAAGISGYLLKSVDRTELATAIRSVYANPDRMVLSISREMAQVAEDRVPVLSTRELDVLQLAARALTNSQIASRLNTSEATVKRQLHSVFAKLGAVSRIDAVNKAIAASLIGPVWAGEAAQR